MDIKYQVFISSTYNDLKDFRRKIQDVILSMQQFPVGMELFSAADEEQWEIIKETIDSSDYYLLILGQKYGSIVEHGGNSGFSYDEEGISYTEKEYRYAKETGIPILTFLIDKDASITVDQIEDDATKRRKLDTFKQSVSKNKLVEWWKTPDELAKKVAVALQKQINRKKRPGWVRSDVFNIEESHAELLRLNKRIRELEEENRELKTKIADRAPSLSVHINCEGKWRIHFKQIECPEYVLVNYEPLTLNDVIGVCKGEITQKEIDRYNNALPSKEVLEDYLNSLVTYKYVTEANEEFEFWIENEGNCKANDINIDIEFPEDLLVLERSQVSDIQEPKAPEKPKNPIEEVYKEKKLGGILNQLELWENVDMKPSSSLLNLGEIVPLLPENAFYHQEIRNNCIHLKIHDLLHTQAINYEEYCVAATRKGKFQIHCSLMCEEYLEPVEQIIEVEAL